MTSQTIQKTLRIISNRSYLSRLNDSLTLRTSSFTLFPIGSILKESRADTGRYSMVTTLFTNGNVLCSKYTTKIMESQEIGSGLTKGTSSNISDYVPTTESCVEDSAMPMISLTEIEEVETITKTMTTMNNVELPLATSSSQKRIPYVSKKKPTLRQWLQTITVKRMLQEKERESAPLLVEINEEELCIDAIKRMNAYNVGSVIVTANNHVQVVCVYYCALLKAYVIFTQPVGIFTERDYIGKLILLGRSSNETLIKEVMTSNPIVVSPEFNLESCSAIMANKEIRHLPVAKFIGDSIDQDSRLVGMISSRDVIHHMIRAAEESSDIELQKGS